MNNVSLHCSFQQVEPYRHAKVRLCQRADISAIVICVYQILRKYPLSSFAYTEYYADISAISPKKLRQGFKQRGEAEDFFWREGDAFKGPRSP